MEYLELSDKFGIVEMAPPEAWYGKSLRQLELRSRFGLNVIAIRQGDSLGISPDIDAPIDSESAMVILGSYDVINRLKKS